MPFQYILYQYKIEKSIEIANSLQNHLTESAKYEFHPSQENKITKQFANEDT